MPRIELAARRIHYYLQNIARDCLPQVLFRSRLERLCADLAEHDAEYLMRRLNYYNKLASAHPLDEKETTVGRIPMLRSRYYYDLKEHARYFPRHFRLRHVFGDMTRVPGEAAIVKSRPIAGDNRNSIIMKLNKFRHFELYDDKISFGDKLPKAVWRGAGANAKRKAPVKRKALVDAYYDHPFCDVGWARAGASDPKCKPFLSPAEQMRYRYIISIEGKDVASNLKWVMASNSLCLMPAPVYETWFMEGTLQPGFHYVQLRPDLADLEETIVHYEKHPDQAREIVCNANSYVKQFAHKRREHVLSLLVLYKYFALTGQLEPNPNVAALWNQNLT